MKFQTYTKTTAVVIYVAAALLLSSCGRLHSPVAEKALSVEPRFSATEIEEVLVPTYSEPEPHIADQYEKPPETIQVQKKTIFLGRTKLSKIEMNFNRLNQKMRINGAVTVLNEKKEEVAKQDFTLEGVLESGKDKLILRPAVPIATNSENEQNIPVVRAQAVCLAVDESHNRFDCSESIIDLFIAYKGQIFTEQLEIAKKVMNSPKTPVRSNDKRESEKNSEFTEQQEIDMNHAGELQTEGEEDSLPGRYEIPTATANLEEIFSEETKPEKAANSSGSKLDIADSTKNPANPAAAAVSTEIATPTATPITPTTPVSSAPMAPITTDKNGQVRFYNQSIGFPDKGRLSNATSLLVTKDTLGAKANFEIVFPGRDRFYGTHEISDMIVRLGNRLSLSSKNKLSVSDISKKMGGFVGSHASHQSGVDADIGYPSEQSDIKFPIVVKRSTGQFSNNAYSVAKTYDLFKYAFYQKDIQVARIFVDQKIKNDLCGYAKSKNELTGAQALLVKNMFESLQHVYGHGDHFHIRLKCSESQPSCRERLYRKVAGCS